MDRFRERVVGRAIGEDTYEAYQLWIRRFEAWFDGSEPSLRDLEDFDTLLYDSATTDYPWSNSGGRSAPGSYSFSSRNQAVSALIMWFRRHYEVAIPEQPGDIVRGEPKDFDPAYLSHEEVQAVIDSAASDCDNRGCEAALRLSYDAILRASELAFLTVGDVSIENDEVAVTAMKGSRDSVLTVSETTTDAIAEYLRAADHSTGPLFRNDDGNGWDKSAWADHVQKNHVPEGSHCWGRHTPILHMFQAGQDFGDVYRRARHQSPAQTAKYARYVDVDVPSWGE
jgi:integrase